LCQEKNIHRDSCILTNTASTKATDGLGSVYKKLLEISGKLPYLFMARSSDDDHDVGDCVVHSTPNTSTTKIATSRGTKRKAAIPSIASIHTEGQEKGQTNDNHYEDSDDQVKENEAASKKKSKPSEKEKHNKCRLCNKSFSSHSGLKYHLNNSVCHIGDEGNEKKSETPTGMPSKKAREAGEYSCQCCKKSFISELGLNYHIKNLVCQNEKRKRGDEETKSKSKRSRGAADSRTCKDCGRVFTSPLGLKYHKGE
jgi:hypothetical protein